MVQKNAKLSNAAQLLHLTKIEYKLKIVGVTF